MGCLSSSAQLCLPFGIGSRGRGEAKMGARAMNCGAGEEFQEFI
jgi:hypothetical protein